MNFSDEIVRFETKKIEPIGALNRRSLFDLADSKEVSLSSLKLSKKMYLILDNLQNEKEIFQNQLKLKDEELFDFKNKSYEMNKELNQSVKGLVEMYDLLVSIYNFVKDNNSDGLLDSMELTLKRADNIISGLGLTMINCLGQKFDHQFSECVGVEDRDDIESDMIIKVVREGYRYKGKLYRASQVIISK